MPHWLQEDEESEEGPTLGQQFCSLLGPQVAIHQGSQWTPGTGPWRSYTHSPRERQSALGSTLSSAWKFLQALLPSLCLGTAQRRNWHLR